MAKRLKINVSLILVFLYSLLCLLFLVDHEWHQYWDSGYYLITARNLANGRGYTYLNQPFFLKPPGFAYFLSWIVNREGEFGFYKLNLISMFLAMGALLSAYVLTRRFHEDRLAVGITLLLGTSPLFVSQFNMIMPGFLFLLLYFLGIWLILPPRGVAQNPIWRGLIGAFLIAVSIYVKTVGLVLLPGMIASGFRNETGARKLTGVVQVLIVLVLLMPWLRYSSYAAEQAPKPTTQLWAFTYTTAMLHQDPGDPGSPYITPRGHLMSILSNSKRLVRDIGRNILHVGNLFYAVVAAMFVCAGFLIAYRRGWSIIEWLSVFFTAVIICYFTYSSRLVLPLVLLFYFYLFILVKNTANWCEKRYKKRHLCSGACLLIFSVLFLFNLILMPRYFDPYYEKVVTRAPQVWRTNRIAADWIKKNTPRHAIILHERAPNFAVLTDRLVYSYSFLRGNPLPEVDFVVLTGKPTYFEPELKSRKISSWVLPGDPPVGDIRIYRVR